MLEREVNIGYPFHDGATLRQIWLEHEFEKEMERIREHNITEAKKAILEAEINERD